MGKYELCPGCPAKHDGDGCCGHPTWVEDPEPEVELLPSRYEIRIYAGVSKVASKFVELDPLDYDNDQKLIDEQLEELAEEFKSERVETEWRAVG